MVLDLFIMYFSNLKAFCALISSCFYYSFSMSFISFLFIVSTTITVSWRVTKDYFFTGPIWSGNIPNIFYYLIILTLLMLWMRCLIFWPSSRSLASNVAWKDLTPPAGSFIDSLILVLADSFKSLFISL
jgi:hypothetical protein